MSEPQYTQIADLKPSMRNLNLRFIVLDVSKAMRTKEGQEVCTVRIADRSGAVNLTIWNELCSLLEPSDICRLHNAYTNVWKGALTVQTGKQGELKRVGQFTFAFSDVPDLSAVVYADWEQGQTQAVASSVGPNKQANLSTNGTFSSGNRHERHDSISSGSAPGNHSHGAGNNHRQHMNSSNESSPTSLPQPNAANQQATTPTGPRTSLGNASTTPGVAPSQPPPANTGGSAPSLNAFRQAFIQPGNANSGGASVPRAANASPTPTAVGAAVGANRSNSFSSAQPQQTTNNANANHKTANEPGRKHVYREIDMFASAPPEKKVRVGDGHAPNAASSQSQHKSISKLKSDSGSGVKATLEQALKRKMT